MLKTPGAFHTPLMAPARDRLLVALRDAEEKMYSPHCDVYMGATGQKFTPLAYPDEIIEVLSTQLTDSVLWYPTVSAMVQDGIVEFCECGPLSELKSMMKRIDTDAYKLMTSIDV